MMGCQNMGGSSNTSLGPWPSCPVKLPWGPDDGDAKECEWSELMKETIREIMKGLGKKDKMDIGRWEN